MRVPFADGTLMRAPDASVLADRRTLVLTADIFPTGFYGARNAFESLVSFFFFFSGPHTAWDTSLELFLSDFIFLFWWSFVSGGSRDTEDATYLPAQPPFPFLQRRLPPV